MQNAIRKGIPFYQKAPRRVALGEPDQRQPTKSIPVAVSYRDGAVLTFLFERSMPIVELSALIARAGQVRKVVL